MRLLKLSVQNFGLFRDRHEFDLAPVAGTDGEDRPLVAVSGPNGVGKSTLFQALSLAFHGPLALGDKVSRQAYSDFLLSRFHRSSQNEAVAVCDTASVALSFEYIQSGERLRIGIDRSWSRTGPNVLETLTLRKDGQALDLGSNDAQEWLNELVPPGLGPVCFFDAEQMDKLADPEQQAASLSDILGRLLGLDLVEKLQSDLERHTLSLGAGRGATVRLRARIAKHQADLDAVNAQLREIESREAALAKEQAKLEAEIAKQVSRLASHGDKYANTRLMLEERLKLLRRDLASSEDGLREQCSMLLPFALAPELCRRLAQRLKDEAEQRNRIAASKMVHDRMRGLGRALEDEDIWRGIGLSEKAREAVIDRVIKRVGELVGPRRVRGRKFVHNLSEPEQDQLKEWIAAVLSSVPDQAKSIGERIRELQIAMAGVESRIESAPSEDILGSLHARVVTLQKELAAVQEQQKPLSNEVGGLQFKRNGKTRQLQDLTDQFRKIRGQQLAEKSKLVLRAYKDALLRERLGSLERALVGCFNIVCKKEQLLGSVTIKPDNFAIELQSTDGYKIGLVELSAGERQLFALALLWALRQVSGRQLPLAIDTPLARLDEIHRARLIHDYVPQVSDQVLFFTTDAELDAGLMAQCEGVLARVYRLSYDPVLGETKSDLADDSRTWPKLVPLVKSW
jgi:DNA sulfur modification protein DndD